MHMKNHGMEMKTTAKTESAAVRLNSDELLCDAVMDALHVDHQIDVRQIRIAAHEGLVCLRGQVRIWYQKQLAQERAKRVAGVEEVRNELKVVPVTARGE